MARIAAPLVVSTVSWTIMNFIDRMFLLWYSLPAFAAAMPAGMLHFTLICFPLGLATYANTFVAQYDGAGRPQRIGPIIWQAVWLGLATAPLILAVAPAAPWIFSLAGHEGEVVQLEIKYFQVMAFGAGGTLTAAALATFYTGRGKTRVVMAVDSGAAVLNIVLDALWIFGRAGFPELGIEGAAWATVVSQWTKAAAYYALMMRDPAQRETYALVTGRRYRGELMRRLWRFGGPNGLQFLVEIGAVSLFILLVGSLGKEAMAATTLAFNVNSMAFVPVIGLGIATSTIVGQQLGRDRPDLASRATYTTLQIALAYTGLMGLLYVAAPRLFLLGHASGVDPNEFGRLSEQVVVLLRFVAAYCMLDATAIVFVSAIKGAGDTRFILRATLITAPLPLLVGYAGIVAGGGLVWCWVVITAWICTMGLVYFLRFLGGKWKSMRVIEPEPLPDPTPPPPVGELVLDEV